MPETAYVLTDGTCVLIGVTEDSVDARIAELQPGNPRRIKLVARIDRAAADSLRVALADRRSRVDGAWYDTDAASVKRLLETPTAQQSASPGAGAAPSFEVWYAAEVFAMDGVVTPENELFQAWRAYARKNKLTVGGTHGFVQKLGRLVPIALGGYRCRLHTRELQQIGIGIAAIAEATGGEWFATSEGRAVSGAIDDAVDVLRNRGSSQHDFAVRDEDGWRVFSLERRLVDGSAQLRLTLT